MKSKFILACEKHESAEKLNLLITSELNKHCPIIEDAPNHVNSQLVTFIYCGDKSTHTASLYTPLIGTYPTKMHRLGHSAYYYYSIVVPNNIRASYAFIPNDMTDYTAHSNERRFQVFTEMLAKTIPDKYNKKTILLKTGDPRVTITTSILEMPAAPSRYWSEKNRSKPAGEILQFNIYSSLLESKRNYWVYSPPLYNQDAHYPLLLVFDGQLYFESGISLPVIIDNLINENKIPPIIAVFIDSVGFSRRAIDLKCSDTFLAFIINELLPDIDQKYSISHENFDRILMGASLGGLFSLYAALQRPDIFGKVLCQSGIGNTISPLIKNDVLHPLHIYIDVGSLENTTTSKEAKDLLTAAGHTVVYYEFPGVHDLVCWETSIPNALIQLLSS